MTMEIKDNFLDNKHLAQLDELVYNTHFPWFLQKEQITGANDGCWFSHVIYDNDAPRSDLYNPVMEIFKNNLKYISLCRITVNLLLRQETPSISDFHTDYQKLDILDEKKITTAIFYLNTNNGATEIKDSPRINSVRNRLIMFPTITPHRAIGPTDVAERIVLNFNFIKIENVTI